MAAGLIRAAAATVSHVAPVALVVCIALAARSAWECTWAQRLNALIADPALIEHEDLPDHPAVQYAAAWRHEQAGHLEAALEHYARAESSDDASLSARARLGMGNVYLHVGLMAADVAAGGSHTRGLAQQQLAREAYRSALRIDPELRAARYNLELLERLSPARRVEGWSRQEDELHLRQGEEQGWAAMKEGNRIRGLP